MNLRNPNVPMEFVENMQGNILLEALNSQRDSGRFCDIVFHVNNKQYQAHRNVLAACSPYFDTVLDKNKLSKEHLSVVCNDNSIFETLVDYMYRGKVTINKENASELLRLANHFIITKLKEHCAEYLERSITVSSCFAIKDMADRCDCSSLAQNTHYFILCNTSEVVRQNEILKFSFGKLENFLSNKLYTLTQEEKFQLILRWVKWDLAERETFFRTLLSYINWSCFSHEVIYNSLKTNDIYRRTETCLISLLQVLEDNQIDFGFSDLLLQHHSKLQQALNNSMETSPFENVTDALGNCNVAVNISHQSETSTITESIKTHKKRFDIFGKTVVKNENRAPLEPQWHEMPKQPVPQKQENIVPDPADEVQDNTESENDDADDISLSKGGRPHKRKGIPIKVSLSGKKTVPEGRGMDKHGLDETTVPDDLCGSDKDEDSSDDVEQSSDNDSDEEETKDQTGKQPNSSAASSDKKVSAVRGRRRKARMKCPKCEFESCNQRRYNSHVNSAHRNEHVYHCNVCKYSCKWNREYYRHMKGHFVGPPFACDENDCSYTVDRIQTLLYHRMKHTDERPFRCSICDQAFRTKCNLKTHRKCHTGEKPFKCEVCERCFATKGTLDQHSVTHSNQRPYLCELCGFSTKYQSHLILHRRIHKGEVFKCQYPNCEYSTPKRSQLGCHMRIHMQIKSHVCETCGRGFTEKSHLIRHERIHSDIKPFQCELCEYSSTRRDKLKDHTKRHHSPKTDKKPRTRKTRNKDVGIKLFPETVNETGVQSPSEYYCDSEPVVDVDEDTGAALIGRELRGSTMTTLTSVTSPTAMSMIPTATTLDTQSLGLLLPTVVAIDARDDDDEADQFRSSLLVSQPHHMSDEQEDNSHGSETFMGVPSVQLQQLTGHSIQLQSTSDLSTTPTHTGHSSDIAGLSSFMSIF